MNCKVKQGCLTSESCCILLWLAFTLFPVSVVTAADNRKIDESQQKEVKAEMKGYVGDENGEPVIGATVLESGTQNGVITDVDGIFTIQLAKNASLTISYVGYQKKTVVVKDKKFISVNLTPDRSMMLDEVVVVGFGKQKKESLVGAVQAVKPEDLKMTSSNLSTSFAGNVPGIIAVQTQGEPGSDEAKFYIRGISTFGSNTSPLIILDGVGKNYRLVHAHDGMEAVIMYDEVKPDLILMDIKMPNLDGLEATKIIRELSATVPIVVQSAYAYPQDQKAAKEAGCSDFISKPIVQSELKKMLNKWLSPELNNKIQE